MNDMSFINIIPITNKRIKNLTGQKIGHLTVLGMAEKPNCQETRAYWWCQCDCSEHNIILVDGKSLRNGNTKSCGCLQKKLARQNAIKRNTSIFPGKGNKRNLTNRIFGKLIALEATNFRANDGSIIWKCKCLNDNNIIFASAHLLLNGSIKSCGCLISNGENKIEQLLKENNIYYKKEFSFSDLYDKSSSYPLRFDFAIFNKNNNLLYLIEYDGIQHFQETLYSHDNFENRKRRDELKNSYCKSHNIPLLRVPYTKYSTLCIKDIILEESL